MGFVAEWHAIQHHCCLRPARLRPAVSVVCVPSYVLCMYYEYVNMCCLNVVRAFMKCSLYRYEACRLGKRSFYVYLRSNNYLLLFCRSGDIPVSP